MTKINISHIVSKVLCLVPYYFITAAYIVMESLLSAS